MSLQWLPCDTVLGVACGKSAFRFCRRPQTRVIILNYNMAYPERKSKVRIQRAYSSQAKKIKRHKFQRILGRKQASGFRLSAATLAKTIRQNYAAVKF